MKKSKKLLTFLLAAVIVIALMLGVVACNVPDDSTNNEEPAKEETPTESLLINNGKFGKTTGSTFVKVPSNWTLTAGSWTKSATGLTAGVVDVSEGTFNENKGAVNSDLDNPGVAPSTPKTDNVPEDTNALVISMDGDEANGSIFYVSSQSKVEKGNYYKISIDVWTDLIFDANDENSDKRGAAIVLSQGTSASSVIVSKFMSINTNSEWQTYTFYVEGSAFEDRNFYIQLWLGYGPTQIKDVVNVGTTAFNSYYTAKGTAMFDNVVMEKIEKSAYDSALVNQYNALTGATETERTQEMQKAYGVEKGKQVVLSYSYLNNNFTGATGYSTSSTTTTYFTSAKVGSTANYTVVKGKKDLKNDDEFPSYTASTDPVGVFDLTKLYYVDSKNSDNYANAYGKVSSSFVAPSHEDLGITYTPENGYRLSTPANPLDNQALLVYHQQNAISGAGFQSAFDILIENNKYYAVSVWVFIWVPEVTEEAYCGTRPTAPEEGVDNYDSLYETYEKELEKYNAKYDKWAAYNSYFERNQEVKATLRLTGASTDKALEATSDGTWGSWQKVTIKVKGNELADRKVGLELWYGEGEWGSENLYPGGCFFDNITIEEYATEEEINTAYTSGEVNEWEKIESEAYQGFGLNSLPDAYKNLGSEETDGWYYDVVDSNTHVDMEEAGSNLYAGILSGLTAQGTAEEYAQSTNGISALANIAQPEKVYTLGSSVFDYVILNNAEYTASKLFFKPSANDTVLKTKPNHFYRLSMWVNTQNLKSGSTFSVSLYDAETKSLIKSNATQSSLAVKEWTEISFVMQSSATESHEMYILVEFGKGDIYTPASHASGAVMITAVTWSSIDYSEYKSASGTYVKSFDLSGSATTGSLITNSDFSTIDSSNYDLDEDAEAVFDEEGEIIGIADPKSWTKASAAYLIAAPSLTVSSSEIQWKQVVKEVTHYHVYDNNKKLVKVIDANDSNNYTETTANEVTTRTYKFTPNSNKYYYVRAIVADGNDKLVCASDYSNSKRVSSASGTVEAVIDGNPIEEALASVKGGIINAKSYKGEGLGEDFYATTDAEGMNYVSTLSSNLLMLSSSYPTYFGYTNSSSVSLSTESYYRMSVWVKTVDGAKASVTIKNSSNYLAVTTSDEVNGEYVGYTGVDTEGAWVRYDFYIATNLSAGSITLELYLGNKYANNTVALSAEEGATKVSAGTSTGTVYFDDVMLVKLSDEAAYNKLVYGVENLDDITEDTLKEKLTAYGVDVNAEGADISVKALLNARKTASLQLLAEKDATGSYFNNAFNFELVNYNTDSFDSYDKKSDDADNNLEALAGNKSKSFTHYSSSSVYNGDLAGESSVKDNDYPNHVYGVYNKNGDFEELIAHMTAKDYLPAGSTYALADAFSAEQIRSFLSTTYAGDSNNNNYLMMANITKPSTQLYQTSSLTMAASSYYKITFYAKYLAVDASKKPEFRFIYDNKNDYWETIQISASDDMVEYTFYYANESTKSVSAYLAYFLGSNDAQGVEEAVKNLMAGILIVDDLSIVKLSQEDYAAAKSATEADSTKAGTFNSYLTEAEKPSDENPVKDPSGDDNEKNDNKRINPQVWLIVSSVIIGVILVAVIVVMVYRKIKTKLVKKLRKTKVDSAMPADFEKKQAAEKVRKNADGRKKDIDTSDYDD